MPKYDGKVLLGRDALVAAMDCAISVPGVTAPYGVGRSGKTELAESIVSLQSRFARETTTWVQSSSCIPSVVAATLKSWFSPSFFSAALQSGAVTEGYLEKWTTDLLSLCGLDDFQDIAAFACISNHLEWDKFEHALQIATFSFDKKDPDSLQRLGSESKALVEVDSSGTVIRYFWPVSYPSGQRAPYMLAQEPSANFQLETLPSGWSRAKTEIGSTLTLTDLPIDVSNIRVATKSELEASTLLNDVNFTEFNQKLNSTQSGSVSSPTYLTEISTRSWEPSPAIAAVAFLKEVGTKDHRLCFTPKGFKFIDGHTMSGIMDGSLREGAFKEGARSAATSVIGKYLEAIAKEAPSGFARRELQSVDMNRIYNDMVTADPVFAFGLVHGSGLISEYAASSTERAVLVGTALQKLARKLDFVEKPTLILTEMKAIGEYGAYALNAELEEKRTTMRVRLKSGLSIDFDAKTSLLYSTVGALIFTPVVHVSTLDLTLIHALVVKSATQSGGLDSSMLNILQFVSNQATLTGSYIVMETRDDFISGNKSAEDARERARNTLGANSTLSILIYNETPEEPSAPRNLDVRFKGGSDYDDVSFEGTGLKLEHYPKNDLRDKANLTNATDGRSLSFF